MTETPELLSDRDCELIAILHKHVGSDVGALIWQDLERANLTPARAPSTVGVEAREKEITRLATIEECAQVCEARIKRDEHGKPLGEWDHYAPYNSEDMACAKAIRALAQSSTLASEKEGALRTCATCHAILADGPQPAMTYESSTPARPDGEAVAWQQKLAFAICEEICDQLDGGVNETRELAARVVISKRVKDILASPPPASAGVREADSLAEAWHEIKRASDRNENKEDGGLVLACSMIERRRLRMGLQPIGSIPSALAPGEKK